MNSKQVVAVAAIALAALGGIWMLHEAFAQMAGGNNTNASSMMAGGNNTNASSMMAGGNNTNSSGKISCLRGVC